MNIIDAINRYKYLYNKRINTGHLTTVEMGEYYQVQHYIEHNIILAIEYGYNIVYGDEKVPTSTI